jgi:hypothetical protein
MSEPKFVEWRFDEKMVELRQKRPPIAHFSCEKTKESRRSFSSMVSRYRLSGSKRLLAHERTTTIFRELEVFLTPLLAVLDAYVDQRVVYIFLQTIQAIVPFRNSSQGLLASELESYVASFAQDVAGSKNFMDFFMRRGSETIS